MLVNCFRIRFFVFLLPALATSACKKAEEQNPAPTAENANPLEASDTPVLEIKPGAEWTYQVKVEAPQDLVDGKPVSAVFERKRRYLGKIDPGNGREKTDCFEVWANGTKRQREYVKISAAEVSLSGQSQVDKNGEETRPIWFQEPILFFRAGLVAGDTLPSVVFDKNKELWRSTRVIGREKISVPAGDFEAVRLQMIGRDENVALRRTYWFCPGTGIIKEEKIREIDEKPVLVETEELSSMSGLR
jgi:hypothetical protein